MGTAGFLALDWLLTNPPPGTAVGVIHRRDVLGSTPT